MIRMASRDLRLLLSVILTSTKLMTSSPSSSPPMALITIRTDSSLDVERTAKEAASVDSEALVASALRCSTMISSREVASALPHSVLVVSEAAWEEPQNP
jgi:hypothetical protein